LRYRLWLVARMLLLPRSQVVPSGALRAASSAAILPPARPVLDHHLLVPKIGELLAQGAREDVARTPGGEADDEAHRLPRPALGTGSARKRESCEQGGGDAFHGLFLPRT